MDLGQGFAANRRNMELLILVSVPLIDRSGAGALCALAGCYIGKAEFRGEDMKMYPFFGTSAAPMPQ